MLKISCRGSYAVGQINLGHFQEKILVEINYIVYHTDDNHIILIQKYDSFSTCTQNFFFKSYLISVWCGYIHVLSTCTQNFFFKSYLISVWCGYIHVLLHNTKLVQTTITILKALWYWVTSMLACSFWPRGYKTFSMLNWAEHEIYPAHKYQNANNCSSFASILYFMSSWIFVLSWIEQ